MTDLTEDSLESFILSVKGLPTTQKIVVYPTRLNVINYNWQRITSSMAPKNLKSLSWSVIVTVGIFAGKSIKAYNMNTDTAWVDHRYHRAIMRKYKRRMKTIKLAMPYTVTQGEIADNLYGT